MNSQRRFVIKKTDLVYDPVYASDKNEKTRARTHIIDFSIAYTVSCGHTVKSFVSFAS